MQVKSVLQQLLKYMKFIVFLILLLTSFVCALDLCVPEGFTPVSGCLQQVDRQMCLQHLKTVQIDCANGTISTKNFDEIQHLTILQFVEAYITEPKPYYCLLYLGKILYPSELISQIRKEANQIFKMKLLTETAKLVYAKFISNHTGFDSTHFPIQNQTLRTQIENISQVFTKSGSKPEYQDPNFFLPLLYYTQNENGYFRKANSFLFKVNMTDQGSFSSKNPQFPSKEFIRDFQFTSSLTGSLQMLPRFIGQVHRGVPKIRNPTRANQLLYLQGFSSSSISQEMAINYSQAYKKKETTPTVFHIKSLSGKELGMYSSHLEEREVLFNAFTYFIVDDILVSDLQNEIWMSEMPTPVYFNRDLVLWLDQNPKKYAQTFQQMQKQNMEVLPITSNRIAQYWVNSFSWIFELQNIRIRLVHIEKQGELKEAFQTFMKIGLKSKVLVYFEEPGNNKLQNLYQQYQNVEKVTSEHKDIYQFLNFKYLETPTVPKKEKVNWKRQL